LPSIGEVEPEAVRIAIRPIPGDHLSAIGGSICGRPAPGKGKLQDRCCA
jgi:hypothetical protein